MATAAREPQPDYDSRMNHHLMLVIEDQWRKQLHEEQKEEEEQRKIDEAAKVEVIVTKDRRRTIQGRGSGDNKGKEMGRRRLDERSSQQVIEDDMKDV